MDHAQRLSLSGIAGLRVVKRCAGAAHTRGAEGSQKAGWQACAGSGGVHQCRQILPHASPHPHPCRRPGQVSPPSPLLDKAPSSLIYTLPLQSMQPVSEPKVCSTCLSYGQRCLELLGNVLQPTVRSRFNVSAAFMPCVCRSCFSTHSILHVGSLHVLACESTQIWHRYKANARCCTPAFAFTATSLLCHA